MNDVLKVTDLARSFTQGGVTIDVLRGVDLRVGEGEIVALLGPSGSGKSTLLQAVGLLEGGFEGSIRIAGEEAAKLDNDGRTRLRRDALGFVYQFHHLLPDFNATENVVLPQVIRDADMKSAQARAESLLTSLGLGHRLDHRPSQLSGGEQQRVAVARALVVGPDLLLLDEPFSALDRKLRETMQVELKSLLLDRGDFLYDSDVYDDDIPRMAGDHVLLPYAFDTNDMRFSPGGGFVQAADFSTYVTGAFDRLYAEGARAARMMSIGLHLRLIGRPGRIAGLEDVLAHIARETAQ